MAKGRILCISAGMLKPKKVDNPVARLHMYLNYGLLGLASILGSRGYEPTVVHGRFEEPEAFVLGLQARGLLASAHPILLSLPSSFALPWARAACAAIRAVAPETRIVVGGRWVVANDPVWIKSQLPQADEFIEEHAESRIEQIVDPRTTCATPHLSQPDDGFMPALNYLLLEGWQEFQPSIEVSRGCGMHCTFCAEAEVPLSIMKPPGKVADEVANYEHVGGGDECHPYFEASIFQPSTVWSEELTDHLVRRGLRVQWRAESRVDVLSPRQISGLAQAGLRILDLGLESGSPAQLIAMKKTPRPDVYLSRASNLLRACHENGVWTKVNILLYPGETWETLQQTTEWLERHRPFIKGLSVGPTILYRYGQSSRTLLEEFGHLGAVVTDPRGLDAQGYTHLDLSSEITHAAALAFSTELSKSFMTSRDYYDLKVFSYLPRGFSWEQFQRTIDGRAAEDLPFRV